MSDQELQQLERAYALGDRSVYPRLVRLRFRADPNVNTAAAIINSLYQQGETLELTAPYAELLLAAGQLGRQYFPAMRVTLQGINLHNPHLPSYMVDIRKAKEQSRNRVCARLGDEDLTDLGRRTDLFIEIESLARRFQNAGIYPQQMHRIEMSAQDSYLRHSHELLAAREERGHLQDQYNAFLRIVHREGADRAGPIWYEQQCQIYETEHKTKVLRPQDTVIFYDPAGGEGEQGIYSPQCFFPFYDYFVGCNEGYHDASILAALQPEDGTNCTEGWEEDFKEEAAAEYAAELDITADELLEGDDYYDDYRQFNRHYEEELLPKRKEELILEAIDEHVEQVFSEYMDACPRLSIAEMWQQLAEGHVEDYDVWWETDTWLDEEQQSAVSELVNEPFERWTLDGEGGGEVHVELPETLYRSKRYSGYRRSYGGSESWRQLNTIPACRKPPMLKVDTSLIGWKVAFGLEPYRD